MEGESEVEELVMIMIRRKGERKNTKNMTRSDRKKGGSKRKRKRKNAIRKIKTHNTIQHFHSQAFKNIFNIIINYD